MKKMSKLEFFLQMKQILYAICEEFEKDLKEIERLENLIKEQEQIIVALRNRLETKENE